MQRIYIIFACFFICADNVAQQYPFVHYTPKDGLVNSRVKKAYQDSKGRMYFLTYGGLSMYDGTRFRNYTTQNGLPINIVNDILETGDDSLLVATNSGYLNLLTNGRIEPFKTENNFCPLVNRIYRHDDNRIYLSSDYGLFRLDKNKIHQLNISSLTGSDKDQPNLGNITGVGNFLLLTINEMNFNTGIFLYDIKKNRICDMLSNTAAFLMDKDEKNRIWISTVGQLLILDRAALENGKLSLIPPDKGYSQIKNYSTVNMAFHKNQVWLVYRNEELRNSELRRIDEDGNMISINLPVQAATSYISNVFIDREKNIWLCNDGEAVFKFIRSPLQVFEKPFSKSTESQISYVFYSHDISWYGTITGKLFRRSATALTEFTCNLKSPPKVFYSKGNRMLANDGQNIYEAYLPDQTKNINYKKIISLPDSDHFDKKLIVSPDGAIITATQNNLCVWINNKLIFRVPVEGQEMIEGLEFDKTGRLWLTTRTSGIKVYSVQAKDTSAYLQPVIQIPVEQITGSVRSFIMDKAGRVWIGTRDHGILSYQLNGNRLIKKNHFHTGNGLTDNFVTSLACDSMNNIIIGTQTGLDRLLQLGEDSYRVENLSKSNNLFTYINNTWADARHAYAITKTGVLLQVSQSAPEAINHSPQLLLEELKVNATSLVKQKTEFKYKENNISFFVAAPSFIDEKQVRYAYLLEGSGNNQWSDTASANSIINLTNLSAGDYNLKVKAFFPSNSYPPAKLDYSFKIVPPWWQTRWFGAAIGITGIGILIMLFRFYFRRKLEKQMAVVEKQQAIEKERTRIATDMHDDLGAGLSRIKFLSETIGIKKQQQQPFEEDISKIREYSHEMIDKMGEIVWALNEKNDSLSDLLSYTRAYAVEYLSQNGIQCRVNAPDNLPLVFVSGEFRRNVFLTVKEALHNVVKHAQASEVNVTINISDVLVIGMNDNGTGFDKNSIRSFSNGLANMEKRIKEIGGQLHIEQENGTLVQLAIPLQG